MQDRLQKGSSSCSLQRAAHRTAAVSAEVPATALRLEAAGLVEVVGQVAEAAEMAKAAVMGAAVAAERGSGGLAAEVARVAAARELGVAVMDLATPAKAEAVAEEMEAVEAPGVEATGWEMEWPAAVVMAVEVARAGAQRRRREAQRAPDSARCQAA